MPAAHAVALTTVNMTSRQHDALQCSAGSCIIRSEPVTHSLTLYSLYSCTALLHIVLSHHGQLGRQGPEACGEYADLSSTVQLRQFSSVQFSNF